MQFVGKIEPAAGATIVGSLPLTSSCSVIRMSALESCRRGDENVLPPGAVGVRVGTPSGRCGLHALPRPTAWQPLASPGDRTLRRTAIPLFPRFVYVLRVLEGYSLSYVTSILNVDKEACQAALNYSFGALAEVLMPVRLAKQQ
jgi:hypothetical protein